MTQCNKCNIGKYQPPYIGSEAKYVIVGESPSSASTLLTPNKSDFWKLLATHGLRKIDFAIVHSINCFIEGKPSEYHRQICRPNIQTVIEQVKPKLIISSGNFALHTLTGKWGIRKYENKIETVSLFNSRYKIMYWTNINNILYNNNIQKSIKIMLDS